MREFYTGNALREIIEAKAKHVAAKMTVISIDDLKEKITECKNKKLYYFE